MTPEELQRFDGRDGRPAYVAIAGVIYDVSDSPLWKEGNHEGAHQAGTDLTADLKSAPHVAAVIERFPSLGRLEEPLPEKASSGGKAWLIAAIALAAALTGWFLTR